MSLFRGVLPWLFAVLHWNGTTGIQTPRGIASETGALPPGTEPFQQPAGEVSDPALAAGFRSGDRLDARELYRANGFANPVLGVPYKLIAHRGARTTAATPRAEI